MTTIKNYKNIMILRWDIRLEFWLSCLCEKFELEINVYPRSKPSSQPYVSTLMLSQLLVPKP